MSVGDIVISVVPWALGAVVLVGVIASLLFNVSGTWERIPTDQEYDQARASNGPIPTERIVLGQLGPFVTGRRELPGGHQEFSGFIIGRTVRLNRRDHGVASLVKQGFPEKIAHSIDGDITGKLKLQLVESNLALVGSFTPQKIEFTHRPPKITGRHFLDAVERRYRRLTAKEIAVSKKVVQSAIEEQMT